MAVSKKPTKSSGGGRAAKVERALAELERLTELWAGLTVGEALERARKRGLVDLPQGDQRQAALVLGAYLSALLGEALDREGHRRARKRQPSAKPKGRKAPLSHRKRP